METLSTLVVFLLEFVVLCAVAIVFAEILYILGRILWKAFYSIDVILRKWM